jgi:outer membrane lipoprotein-sorting protein
MKRVFFFLAAVFFLFSVQAASQSLNEIIDLQFDAVKQDKFNKLQTIIKKITIKEGSISTPMIIYHKRPNKIRIESGETGNKNITTYNGKTGWSFSKEIGDTAPQTLTGRALEEIKFMADLDGYFFCYRERGHDLELIGTEKVGGKNTFKIRCTKPTGDEALLYLDAKTYLLTKTIQRLKDEDVVHEKETIIGDYKSVEGIPMPFKFQISERSFPKESSIGKEGGKTVTQLITNIELNKELPDLLFDIPDIEQ